jgi:hypothetical protein
MSKHNTRLKDLGSGNGFMLPPNVFYYSGRRSYLYPETDHDHSKVDPPEEFMNKRQVLRLRHLDDARCKLASSQKLRRIHWMVLQDADMTLVSHGRPATTGEVGPRKAGAYQSEKVSYNYGPRGRGRGYPPSRRASDLAEEDEWSPEDWVPQFEAGVRFFTNAKTGECRETVPPPPALRKPSSTSNRRPSTAPACVETLSSAPPGSSPAHSPLPGHPSPGKGPGKMLAPIAVNSSSPGGQEPLGGGTGALVYDPTEFLSLMEFLDGKRIALH